MGTTRGQAGAAWVGMHASGSSGSGSSSRKGRRSRDGINHAILDVIVDLRHETCVPGVDTKRAAEVRCSRSTRTWLGGGQAEAGLGGGSLWVQGSRGIGLGKDGGGSVWAGLGGGSGWGGLPWAAVQAPEHTTPPRATSMALIQ